MASSNPKYKACIREKGFWQVFSPVVKMSTLRFLLDVVALEDMELVQLDVKTAFLHGDLEDEIYMEQPQGFASHGHEHLVCRLHKSLYGLKQAPRQWYRKFDDLFNPSAFFVRMRTIFSIVRMHLMRVPFTLSFTWMICYSSVDILKSLPRSDSNCS